MLPSEARGGGTSLAILFFEGSSSLEGYNITATPTIGSSTYTTTLDSNGQGYLEVPGLDRYTVVLSHEENGEPVIDYTEICNASAGEFCYMWVGYTTSTWAGVKRIINDGKTSQYISNGDRFTVVLDGGETLIYEANVNTYGLGEVDFIPTYLLTTLKPMNSSATNAGGWNGCLMRTWLNETFIAQLPSDLQAVISNRDTIVSSGNKASTLVTSIDKIWLPCDWEVRGSNTHSASTENSIHTRYYSFTQSIIRTLGSTGSPYLYFVASADISNTSCFCSVNASGGGDSYPSASSTCGVLPCFRIAPDTN